MTDELKKQLRSEFEEKWNGAEVIGQFDWFMTKLSEKEEKVKKEERKQFIELVDGYKYVYRGIGPELSYKEMDRNDFCDRLINSLNQKDN